MPTGFGFVHGRILPTQQVLLSNPKLGACLDQVDGVNGTGHIFEVGYCLGYGQRQAT